MENTKLANFGNHKTCQFWKSQNLPHLEIIRLANFGYNKNYQFLSQKRKLNPTSKNLEYYYKRAGEFIPILESCL